MTHYIFSLYYKHFQKRKAGEIKNFEDKAFNFTQGEFAGGSLTLSKIIEGIVIISSIGIAVYLLFAVRK